MTSFCTTTALAGMLTAPIFLFPEVAAGTVFPKEYIHIAERRHLATCSNSDDALDPTQPNGRDDEAFSVREEAALRERRGTGTVCQFKSKETDLAAKFHKTLPHDDLGQVSADDFTALENCIASGDFDTCETVPAGDLMGRLSNPIAAFAVDVSGPAFSATTVPPAPTLDSAELAAELAEGYWMALARDVPFSEYGTNLITTTAADNLAGMEGFSKLSAVAMKSDGSVDAFSQLFRPNFVGVESGPFISQLLVNNFIIDSIEVVPKQTTFAIGVDYMTDYAEWLRIQNGGAPDGDEQEDPEPRFIRSARDLARLVFTDSIYTEAFRGALILLEQGAFDGAGANGPYADSDRQRGFVNFGISDFLRKLGSADLSVRSAWYQKWQVHRFARPEALAGTVHNTLMGKLDAPIHKSLLENAELLELVAEANAAQNADGAETYLLSQGVKEGSPSHPSYPAAHGVQNGAYATVLKALVGLSRGSDCFKTPLVPDDDGLERSEYKGSCLTFEGEINKLAVNVAFGRQMLGVHYRMDSTQGLILGETIAIRTIHQELMSFPENDSLEFRLFTGEVIKLFPDGSFSIDDNTCQGEVYTDVSEC